MLGSVIGKGQKFIGECYSVKNDRDCIIGSSCPGKDYMIKCFPVTVMDFEGFPFFRQAWFEIQPVYFQTDPQQVFDYQ